MAVLAASACTLFEPEQTQAERARVEQSGAAYATPHEWRELEPLAEPASLEGVLAYAFRSNAELEMRYFEWAAALQLVPQVSSLPDPSLSFEFLFSDERMKRWDRTTLGVSQMLPLPAKLTRAGEVALQDAVAARHRLEEAKFSLQAEVVGRWYEIWRVDRTLEVDEANLALLQQLSSVTRELVAVGRTPQAEASKADLEIEMAANDLLTERARRPAAQADLNALLSRAADTPLTPAVAPPPPELPDEAVVIALAAERNPELAALAAEIRGRENALELARLAWVPDLALGVEVMGSAERSLMAMINAPLQVPRIRAGIAESQASLRVAQAALRARKDRLGARLALELYVARDSLRQLELYRDTLLPRARDVVSATETAYTTGTTSFLDLLDAQRSLLSLELGAIEVQASGATAVAALEALCALDFGALPRSAP